MLSLPPTLERLKAIARRQAHDLEATGTFTDRLGVHTRRQWLRARRIAEIGARSPIPSPPPDLSASDAVAAAKATRIGKTAIFRLTIRHMETRGRWLDLEAGRDDRNPGDVVIALSPADQNVLRKALSPDLKAVLLKHTVRAAGHVREANGRAEIHLNPMGAVRVLPQPGT